MPHISQLKDSKFLKKEDCGRGILVTIDRCVEENVAKEGATPEMKWCLYFHEHEKPMVLNITNGQIIAQICGSEETDGWIGHKIVLYNEPNITFGSKLVGGIRARAPRNQPNQAKPKHQPVRRPVQPPPVEERYPVNEDADSFQPGGDDDGSIPF